MESLKDRPIMTCDELCSAGSPGCIPKTAMLTAGELLKMVAMISGQKTTRRTLQFYSSPQVRAIPKPLHFRGHRAHYLHPEHSVRFAVLLHLRAAYYLPLKVAKMVLDAVPVEHYSLLLEDVLSAADMVRMARDRKPKAWLRDTLVGRASRALHAARLIEGELIRPNEPPFIASAWVDHQKAFGPESVLAGAGLPKPDSTQTQGRN